MNAENTHTAIPEEILMNKIFFIRGQKVMLDADLAELYNIETKRLKEQVKRNMERFPKHFMFELTAEENESLRSQFATLKRGGHSKYLPFAFTEHGILMLSNVLKSERAVAMSIRIIDVFIKLREMLFDNTEIRLEIEQMKKKLNHQGTHIETVFQYLDKLMARSIKPKKRVMIGFKQAEKRQP